MALLDGFFQPQYYGGAQGLLSRLQPMAQMQSPPATQFPTTESLIPPTAQPTQAQLPAQQQPGVLDGISNGLANNPQTLLALGAGLMQGGFGKGLQLAAATGQRPNTNLTDDIKEFQFAKTQGFKGTWEDWMRQKRSTTGEYGMTPQWAQDPKTGKTIAFQLGKNGEARRVELPDGVEWASGIEKLDLGTQWGLRDKRTGQVIGYEPKNVQEAAAQRTQGEKQGEARAELPAAQITADRTVSQIEDFINTKGFDEVFGAVDQYRPNWTMSDAGRDALARFKQLSGRAFLEGRSMLKGGGAITDFESNKAEAAIARLERSLNETDARAALRDFQDAVREGAKKLAAKASGQQPAAAPSANTAPPPAAPMSLDDLVKKYSR